MFLPQVEGEEADGVTKTTTCKTGSSHQVGNRHSKAQQGAARRSKAQHLVPLTVLRRTLQLFFLIVLMKLLLLLLVVLLVLVVLVVLVVVAHVRGVCRSASPFTELQ